MNTTYTYPTSCARGRRRTSTSARMAARSSCAICAVWKSQPTARTATPTSAANVPLTLTIIKQAGEHGRHGRNRCRRPPNTFSKLYPDIEFLAEPQSQTELLDYTISNLVQNLILGFILVFMVTAFFHGRHTRIHHHRRQHSGGYHNHVPAVLSLPVSLSIISLSGLILAS